MQSSLTIHIREFRYRLLYCFLGWCFCILICSQFLNQMLYFYVRPYLTAILENFEKNSNFSHSNASHCTEIITWERIQKMFENSNSPKNTFREFPNSNSAGLLSEFEDFSETFSGKFSRVLGNDDAFVPFLQYDPNVLLSLSTSLVEFQIHQSTSFLCTNITEAFYTSLHCCWVSSFWLVLPLLFYSFWCYFIPACTSLQRYYLTFYFIVIVGLLFTWGLFVCFVVLPKLCYWLLCFETNVDLGPLHGIYQAKMLDSVCYVTTFLHWSCLLGTIIPALILLFIHKGWIRSVQLINRRRIVYFVCILFSSIIAPPDPMVQCILTFFLFLGYETIILFSLFFSTWAKW